jgi:hypothetical protein
VRLSVAFHVMCDRWPNAQSPLARSDNPANSVLALPSHKTINLQVASQPCAQGMSCIRCTLHTMAAALPVTVEALPHHVNDSVSAAPKWLQQRSEPYHMAAVTLYRVRPAGPAKVTPHVCHTRLAQQPGPLLQQAGCTRPYGYACCHQKPSQMRYP